MTESVAKKSRGTGWIVSSVVLFVWAAWTLTRTVTVEDAPVAVAVVAFAAVIAGFGVWVLLIGLRKRRGV